MRGRGRLQANGTGGGSVGQGEWPGTQGSGTASCSRRLCKIHLQISAGIRGLLQIRIKPFRHQEGLGTWAALFCLFSINYQGLPKWLGMPGCGGERREQSEEENRLRRESQIPPSPCGLPGTFTFGGDARLAGGTSGLLLPVGLSSPWELLWGSAAGRRRGVPRHPGTPSDGWLLVSSCAQV